MVGTKLIVPQTWLKKHVKFEFIVKTKRQSPKVPKRNKKMFENQKARNIEIYSQMQH